MSVERVAEFEREAKLKLPADYRAFLTTHAGATAINGVVRVAKTRLRTLFTLFDDDFSRSLVQRRELYAQRMPPGTLPIGNDAFGNCFCLGAVGVAHESKVYFWDHDLEADDDETPSFENMTLIANSFTEFLALVERESSLHVKIDLPST